MDTNCNRVSLKICKMLHLVSIWRQFKGYFPVISVVLAGPVVGEGFC